MLKDSDFNRLTVDPTDTWPVYSDYVKSTHAYASERHKPDTHSVIDNGEIDAETGMKIVRHEIVDPYAAESPEDFQYISDLIKEFESMGWQGDGNPEPDITRKRKSEIDYSNPSTEAFLESAPCARDWLSIMPSASALEPLYDPNISHYSNGKAVSPEAKVFFKNCMDAIGMRNRGKMTSWLIENEASDFDRTEPFTVYSLGCGAASPVLEGLKKFSALTGVSPQATLVDIDKNSLSLARRYASELDLDGVSTRRQNILRQSGIADKPNWFKDNVAMRALLKKGQLQPNQANVVDAIGILEYLKPEDWPFTYKGVISTEMQMAGAVSFLKNASRLVKPGGRLVVGNMFVDRPQLAFTLNTVQWPHVQPREPKEMKEIFDEAGLPKERTLHVSNDHLYGLYVMDFS